LITKYFSQEFSFDDAFKKSVLSYLFDSGNIVAFTPIKNLNDIQKRIFIHIEEPELSLYPDSQCGLIDDIILQCF
jgi:predicted ATPase